MTLHTNPTPAARLPAPPERTPRLRLKPKAPTSGYVDGAWWPRSDDLAAELPELLAVLGDRLGGIERVTYNTAEWAPTQANLTMHGRRVRLDGYSRQPHHTVQVIAINRGSIALLVVPPNAEPDQAHATLMAAATPTDASTIDHLLHVRQGADA